MAYVTQRNFSDLDHMTTAMAEPSFINHILASIIAVIITIFIIVNFTVVLFMITANECFQPPEIAILKNFQEDLPDPEVELFFQNITVASSRSFPIYHQSSDLKYGGTRSRRVFDMWVIAPSERILGPTFQKWLRNRIRLHYESAMKAEP